MLSRQLLTQQICLFANVTSGRLADCAPVSLNISTCTVGDIQFFTICSNWYYLLLKSVGIEDQH